MNYLEMRQEIKKIETTVKMMMLDMLGTDVTNEQIDNAGKIADRTIDSLTESIRTEMGNQHRKALKAGFDITEAILLVTVIKKVIGNVYTDDGTKSEFIICMNELEEGINNAGIKDGDFNRLALGASRRTLEAHIANLSMYEKREEFISNNKLILKRLNIAQ